MIGDPYICGLCGGEFLKEHEEAEVREEYKALFPEEAERGEETCTVCQSCFEVITFWAMTKGLVS